MQSSAGEAPTGTLYTYVYPVTGFTVGGNDEELVVPTATFEMDWSAANTHVSWYRPVELNFIKPDEILKDVIT